MPIKPSVFALKPMGDYGHRLVIDLYSAASAVQSLAQGQTVPDKPLANNAPAAPQAGNAAPKFTRLMMIAIDAGHGGEDPGAKGASGSLEKHITLKVARKLKEKIDAEPNMRAYLTRDGDYFIPRMTA